MGWKPRAMAQDGESAPDPETGTDHIAGDGSGPGAGTGSTGSAAESGTGTGRGTARGRGTEKGTMLKHTPGIGEQKDLGAVRESVNESIENEAERTVQPGSLFVHAPSLRKSLMLDPLSAPSRDIMMNATEKEIVNVNVREKEIPPQGENLSARGSEIGNGVKRGSLLIEALLAISATFQKKFLCGSRIYFPLFSMLSSLPSPFLLLLKQSFC